MNNISKWTYLTDFKIASYLSKLESSQGIANVINYSNVALIWSVILLHMVLVLKILRGLIKILNGNDENNGVNSLLK